MRNKWHHGLCLANGERGPWPNTILESFAGLCSKRNLTRIFSVPHSALIHQSDAGRVFPLRFPDHGEVSEHYLFIDSAPQVLWLHSHEVKLAANIEARKQRQQQQRYPEALRYAQLEFDQVEC